jgi:hypothetical protein
LSKSEEERDRGTGYAYDWIRYRQNAQFERKRESVKLKKKINRLARTNHYHKPQK